MIRRHVSVIKKPPTLMHIFFFEKFLPMFVHSYILTGKHLVNYYRLLERGPLGQIIEPIN